MPFRIIEPDQAPASPGAFSSGGTDDRLTIRLWPHSSLTPEGFVGMIGVSFAMLCIPLLGLIGTAALWGILPFAIGTLGLLWLGLKRSWRDRSIEETFELTPREAHLTRRDPDGRIRDWRANPYWVRVEMSHEDGPVEDYLTLQGGPRPVEIGAFLTPEERRALRDTLQAALAGVRNATRPG
ncbi:DUF2244 domain-containing protein [Jannaschia sp. LMIT008]|uniref:DUF2244 domain-containing protein n=1 Tax=Jannaschia maritima TaxID=3032585 RepID=UPI002811617C|nr:DUF2244 domain-containing protein [Jannaschia sp. LMIT008]